MVVLFLEIDGVLNDHTNLESGYCGVNQRCVSKFNAVLDAFPDLKIVISSAWRYMVLSHKMHLSGFEMLLLTHGVKCHDRIIGHTAPDGRIEDEPNHQDPEAWSIAVLKWRREQIYEWVRNNGNPQFVVVDDLDLGMPELIQTDGTLGLSVCDVDYLMKRIAMLSKGMP